MNKEFILTDRGLIWLKRNLANTFGLDKLIHSEQEKWFDDNIQRILLDRDSYIAKADDPFQFANVVEDYEAFQHGEPVNNLMHVDCSNQALQLYSIVTGDLDTAKSCNLAGLDERTDAYIMVKDELNERLGGGIELSRKDCKKPVMVTLYGSTSAHKELIEPLENAIKRDLESNEVDRIADIFMNTMKSIVPSAMNVMDKIQAYNDENIGTYYWTMYDGFKVKYDVKTKKRYRTSTTSRTGLKLNVDDFINVYGANKYNRGMAPNVIHSIDGYICREIIRRLPHFIVTIHDSYATHYNYIDELIAIYKDILVELLESNILDDILKQINPKLNSGIVKTNTLTKEHIMQSDYALS